MRVNIPASIGRYEILAEIGRGSMGIVYKARDPKIGRIVAIKTILVFDLDACDKQEQQERFYQEARAAGRLSHPGIVTIFDVERNPESDQPYIVMEYVQGKPLNRLLAEMDGKLPMLPALRLAEEIAEALQFAHSQGVIHRDIKPENILLTTEGRPKLADFGIACLDQGHLTVPGRLLGSPAYMSPEQLEGSHLDARSDLFSLGVVLYTTLTGHRPFQGNSTATVCFKLANRDPLPVSSFHLDFPPELDELVCHAMAKDPVQRFQSGMEMAAALKKFREVHEAPPEPLAGILRIIGQETPVLVSGISESDLGPDSLHEVVERALSRQTPPQSEPTVPEKAATAVVGRRENPPGGKPSAKNAGPRPTKMSWNATWGKAVGAGVAALIVIAGLVISLRHRRAPETHSSLPPVITAVAADQTVSQQSSPMVEPTIGSNIQKNAAASARPKARETKREAEESSVRRILPAARGKKPDTSATNGLPASPKTAITATSSNNTISRTDSNSTVRVQVLQSSRLNVIIDHRFEEGEASVSVDNRPVYTERLQGEKKRRALLFVHTVGRQSHAITLPPGQHNIMVRVQSVKDGFDVSESLNQGFSPGSNRTLLVRCDRRKKTLELSISQNQ